MGLCPEVGSGQPPGRSAILGELVMHESSNVPRWTSASRGAGAAESGPAPLPGLAAQACLTGEKRRGDSHSPGMKDLAQAGTPPHHTHLAGSRLCPRGYLGAHGQELSLLPGTQLKARVHPGLSCPPSR